jgi:cation diffusion facilitator family transporter
MTASPGGSHAHVFDDGNPVGERRTLQAVILTLAMMVAEVVGGYWFTSMALLADGWHMVCHAAALGLACLAYSLARKHAGSPRFVFGTWKIEILGGFTSALMLVVIAGAMLWQSISRIIAPSPIMYDEAIAVTVIGLLVNFICAWMLREGGSQGKERDLNLHSAYMHVVADAATSVLAVVALVAGKYWGMLWMDPFMGIVGAVMVFAWALGIIRESSLILLNAEVHDELATYVRTRIEADTALSASPTCTFGGWEGRSTPAS